MEENGLIRTSRWDRLILVRGPTVEDRGEDAGKKKFEFSLSTTLKRVGGEKGDAHRMGGEIGHHS